MSATPDAPEIAISLRGVSKRFRLYRGRQVSTVKDLFVRLFVGQRRTGLFSGEELWALHDVSLDLGRGRMVGIIGSNGSGKSTLLKVLGGILKPTTGQVSVRGRVSALIELGAGFHPEFTGRENIYINGVLLGLTRAEIRARFDEIVAFAGLEAFIDSPVKTYSSGMYMRLGFAIAVTVTPTSSSSTRSWPSATRPSSTGAWARSRSSRRRGKTIVLVSHDLGSIERLCDEAVWLDKGRLQLHGETREVVGRYLDHVAREEARALGVEHDRAEAIARTGTAARWGSREVELTRVQLAGGDGRERYLFETGEPCAVHLSFRAHRPVEDPVFGVGVFRKDGVCCYGTNTAVEGLTFGKVDGEGVVTMQIDRLDLVEGEYLLDVAVHARDGHPYDYHSRLYAFAVRSRVRDTGVARLSHRWRLQHGPGDGA